MKIGDINMFRKTTLSLISIVCFVLCINCVMADEVDALSLQCSPMQVDPGDTITCQLYVQPATPIATMSIPFSMSYGLSIKSFVNNDDNILVMSKPLKDFSIDFITTDHLLQPEDGPILLGTFEFELSEEFSIGRNVAIIFYNAVAGTGEHNKPQVIPDVSATITVNLSPSNYAKGDINANGNIDLQDIILLLKVYLGSEPLDDVETTASPVRGSTTCSSIRFVVSTFSFCFVRCSARSCSCSLKS